MTGATSRPTRFLLLEPCAGVRSLSFISEFRQCFLAGPRFQGRGKSRSASKCALTILCGLLEPRHLVKTFESPQLHNRSTPPPAITPVPSDAGFRMT
jgi:hypothetical protein